MSNIPPINDNGLGMQWPGISFIVPAYGLASLLPDALFSLQTQSFANWEAIVVDDGDDAIAPALQLFADDPRIKLLQTDNAGVATARNRAAALAQAPFIALLDADDVCHPDYAARMMAAVAEKPELGFVTCDACYTGLPDRTGRHFSEFNSQSGDITLGNVLSRRFNIFVGSIIRRTAFDAIGGFREGLRRSEDFDLWLRLLAAGWKAGYVDRPLVDYRRRCNSLSSDEEAILIANEEVYTHLATLVAGTEEAQLAEQARRETAISRQRLRGERMIMAGNTREGIALLAESGGLSPRWRRVLPVIRHMPWLARPLMRMRPMLSPPR